MTYDSITEDGRLWAVKYDDCPDNALYMLFGCLVRRRRG